MPGLQHLPDKVFYLPTNAECAQRTPTFPMLAIDALIASNQQMPSEGENFSTFLCVSSDSKHERCMLAIDCVRAQSHR
jgi:hypothetical protein